MNLPTLPTPNPKRNSRADYRAWLVNLVTRAEFPARGNRPTVRRKSQPQVW